MNKYFAEYDIKSIISPDGELPRKYHNSPVVISGFAEAMTVSLPIGGTLSPTPGTMSEFYTISNMGDSTSQPTLTIDILHGFTDMMVVGGDGTPVNTFDIRYGETATFLKVANGGDCVFVVPPGAASSSNANPETIPLHLNDKWGVVTFSNAETFDAIPGYLNILTGPASLNLPIKSEAGTFLGIKVRPDGDAITVLTNENLLNGDKDPTIQPGFCLYLIFDGDQNWYTFT